MKYNVVVVFRERGSANLTFSKMSYIPVTAYSEGHYVLIRDRPSKSRVLLWVDVSCTKKLLSTFFHIPKFLSNSNRVTEKTIETTSHNLNRSSSIFYISYMKFLSLPCNPDRTFNFSCPLILHPSPTKNQQTQPILEHSINHNLNYGNFPRLCHAVNPST